MRRWSAGEPRVKAWREAQLSLLRSDEFSNPYFWAAFTLTCQRAEAAGMLVLDCSGFVFPGYCAGVMALGW